MPYLVGTTGFAMMKPTPNAGWDAYAGLRFTGRGSGTEIHG